LHGSSFVPEHTFLDNNSDNPTLLERIVCAGLDPFAAAISIASISAKMSNQNQRPTPVGRSKEN
jgi:hypothetical protein